MAELIKSFLQTAVDPVLELSSFNNALVIGGLVLYLVMVLHVILPDANVNTNWTSTKDAIFTLFSQGTLYLPIAGSIFLPFGVGFGLVFHDSWLIYTVTGFVLGYVAQGIRLLNSKNKACETLNSTACNTRFEKLRAGSVLSTFTFASPPPTT